MRNTTVATPINDIIIALPRMEPNVDVVILIQYIVNPYCYNFDGNVKSPEFMGNKPTQKSYKGKVT